MREKNDTGPMRWDEHARGGAGGWIKASEDRPGPSVEPDRWRAPRFPRTTVQRTTVRKRHTVLAVAGGLAVAAIALIITQAVRASVHEADTTTDSSSPGSLSQTLSGSTTADSPPRDVPTTTAEEQADAVDELLERSESDRQQVIDAVDAVEACASDESVDAAGRTLDEAQASTASTASMTC